MKKPFEIKGHFPGMFCKLTPPWECSVCQLLLSADLFSFPCLRVETSWPTGRGRSAGQSDAGCRAGCGFQSRACAVLCCALFTPPVLGLGGWWRQRGLLGHGAFILNLIRDNGYARDRATGFGKKVGLPSKCFGAQSACVSGPLPFWLAGLPVSPWLGLTWLHSETSI